MSVPAVRLHRGRDRRVATGHAWVFANEIDAPVAELPPGGVVDVLDARGRFLGRGHANPASLIAIRLLSADPQADLDAPGFYRDRIAEAWAARQRVLPDQASVRVVAGDADGLSGLVVDRYAPVDGGPAILSLQLTSLGMDRRRDLLQQALEEVLAPAGAVLRNDVGVRALEGLPVGVEEGWGQVPLRLQIAEGPARLQVEPREGQKTGFFLDQVGNRDWAMPRVAGGRVLDAFCHTGAWAIRALLAGAGSAVALDSSTRACGMVRQHGLDNGVSERLEVVEADARQALVAMARQGQRFDTVFLDPPAFAKTRKKAIVALKAYREINRLAMALIPDGGLLFSSSCSHHVQEERFQEAVADAALDLGRRLRLVRRGEQGPDHAVHPAMPETRYLKHLVFQVGGSP